MNAEQYLSNPCGASSLPYWKSKTICIPDSMRIIHDRDFDESLLKHYADAPYFRLQHDLRNLTPVTLSEPFGFCSASVADYAVHIDQCYEDIGITAAELEKYTRRNVYHPALWIAIKDERTDMIAATGIGELDREIGEGSLEWIQVSPDYRGLGLGTCIVRELLWRMKERAKFVTASGQCENSTNPEKLYRKCGFTGNDIWHILTRK